MSGLRIIKYFKGPAFTLNVWETRNPYLKSGEIGYLLEGGVTIGAKVGPGLWVDLGFIGEDVYSYSTDVTNPIGDASGNLQGTKLIDIINMMLSPYEEPAFTNIFNDSTGTYANLSVLEIGESLSSVNIIYNTLNSQNLLGGTPVNITAGGVFNNEGNFANVSPITMSLAAPLVNQIAPQTINITLRAIHTNGTTSGVGQTTQIKFKPRILWLSAYTDTVSSGGQFMGLGNRNSILSADYKENTYEFEGYGYMWIAVPSMLGPNANMIFSDVSNPDAPSPIDMRVNNTFSINNGTGTYNYSLFRSDYYLYNPTKLKIS